jgi:hypothetical protein
MGITTKVFGLAGLACCMVAALWYLVSPTGIHPFLVVLGIVGGLGWLTTAIADYVIHLKRNGGSRKDGA